MAKYEVGIEYGPTAADIHYITVEADSNEDALAKGEQWAVDNKVRGAMVCNAAELTEDDFTDILEWTQEEEEAFLQILENSEDDNGTI